MSPRSSLLRGLGEGDVGVWGHRAIPKAVADLKHSSDDRVGHDELLRWPILVQVRVGCLQRSVPSRVRKPAITEPDEARA